MAAPGIQQTDGRSQAMDGLIKITRCVEGTEILIESMFELHNLLCGLGYTEHQFGLPSEFLLLCHACLRSNLKCFGYFQPFLASKIF